MRGGLKARLQENLPLIILAGVVLAFFRNLVFMRQVPMGSDLKVYYYPGWTYFHSSLSSLADPFWCDHLYCGFPLFADSEAGILYPVNLLSYLLPVNVGYNLIFWLHYLLAAVFFYLYVREIGVSRWPSAVMAVPFALTGFLIAHLVHPNVVATAALLPLFLFCLERGMRRASLRCFVLAGGVMGLQFLAGFLMVPLFGAALAPFYLFLWRPEKGRGGLKARPLAAKGLALTLLVGLGLGMAQNLPSYHLVQESYRAGGLSEQTSNVIHLKPPQMLTFAFPQLFGRGVDAGYWGAWSFEEAFGFVGLLPLFLARFAVGRRRGWHASFFLGVLASSLVLALGNAGLLWRALHALPGFSVLKSPARFLLLADFALLVLGALGLERLIARAPAGDELRRSAARLLAAGAAWSAAWALAAALARSGPGWWRAFFEGAARGLFSSLPGDAARKYESLTRFMRPSNPDFLVPLLLCVIVPLLIWLLARRSVNANAAVAAFLLIAVTEAFFFCGPVNRFTPLRQVETAPPAVGVAASDAGTYRVAIAKEVRSELGEDFQFAPNVPMAWGLDDVRGNSTIPARNYDFLHELINSLFSEKAFGLLNARYFLAQPLRERGMVYDISNPVALCGARPRVTFPVAGCTFDQLCLLSHLQGGDPLEPGAPVARVTVRLDGLALGPFTVRLGRDTEQLEAEELVRSGGRGPGGVEVFAYRHPGWRHPAWSYEGRVRFGADVEADTVEIELDPALYDRVFVLKAVSLHTASGRVRPVERGRVEYTGPRALVYRNPEELPRAFLVGRVEVEEDWQLSALAAFDASRDARESVAVEENMLDPVLKERLNEWEPDRTVRGSVEFVDPDGADKELLIEAEEDGVLFLSQNYLPGWRGTLDGEEIKLMRAYGCLTAAYVPAGSHRLRLRYRVPGLAAGSAVSLAALFASLLLLLFLGRGDRGEPGEGGGDPSPPGPTLPPLPPEPGVSVFFPAYNDEATIGDQVRKALKALEGLTPDYEVIVVDDGSSDSTAAVVEGLMRENDRVRLVRHARNRGYGGALRSGFQAATRQLVFYTDGDGQYDVLELPLLFAKRDQADVVNGYKIKRNDPFYRIWLGSLYNMAARFLFRIRLVDIDCDFRLMRKEALDSLQLESCGGTICLEMVKKLQDRGYTFVEQPVHHYARRTGRSSFFRPHHLYEMGKEFARMWWAMMLKPKLGRRG